jgi:hypothetical protein
MPEKQCQRFCIVRSCFQEFIADRITTRVILPEGSAAVSVNPTAFPTSQEDSRTFSYLDTFLGRPTKVITARNVTRAALRHPVEVRYTFTPVFILLEPALLIGAFLALFLTSIVFSRLDLTIAKDDRWRKRQVRPCHTPCAMSNCFITFGTAVQAQ